MAESGLWSKESAFSVISFLLIAVGIGLGYSGAQAAMAAAIASGLAFLVFGHLDRITEFRASASGIEAKTRKLEDTVTHAERVVEELRTLARVVGRTTLSLAVRTGRFGGYSDEDLQELSTSVHSVFDQLGLSEADKREATTEVEKFTRFDYVASITGPSSAAYVPNNMVEELKHFREWPAGAERTGEELREFMKKADQLSPEVEKLIEDYVYYQRHAKHRRPEIFRKRHEWGELFLEKKW